MDTNQNEAINSPEGTQEAPMPSAEQKPSEQVTPAEGGQETEAPEVEQSEELSLPDGARDRTAEQFDKLKQKLAEERARRLEAEQYLQRPNQSQANKEQKPLYDPVTGYVDVQELERIRLENDKLTQRYSQVEDKFEKYLQKQQETEAYTSYPELNPKAKDYNETMHKAVRALITDSIINPRDYGGNELTMKQAADSLLDFSKSKLKEVEKSVKEKVVKELTPKEQASLEVGSSSGMRTREALGDDVRVKTREGDMASILERMKRLK